MWKNDVYIYSKRMLRNIALNYANLYDGLPIPSGQIMDEWLLTEYQVDFDNALNAIGKGHWEGGITHLRIHQYHGLGAMQTAILADILGEEDNTLEGLGLVRIPRLKGDAYRRMAEHLNGIPFRGSGTRFKAIP